MGDRSWPTVALECGYSQSYEDLSRDATLLLVGFEGRIGKVILIKPDRIGESGTVENSFMEVWEYSTRESGGAKRRGGCFVRLSLAVPLSLLTFAKILPPPQSRQTQAISSPQRGPAGEVRGDGRRPRNSRPGPIPVRSRKLRELRTRR